MAFATKEESKKNLKELKEFWYKKLKETGFEDIEDTTKDYPTIKDWHSRKLIARKTNLSKIGKPAEYFDKALELLETYQFKNDLHRKIWELHCQGLGKKAIEKAIAHIPVKYKTTKPRPYKREAIGIIISVIQGSIK